MAVDLGTWLTPIRREYIETFIPEGGGAVRLVVADPDIAAHLRQELAILARPAGLWPIALDAAHVRLHMLQHVFHAIARALDWDTLLQTRLEHLVARAGYAWPRPGQRMNWTELATHNGVPPPSLLTTLQREINNSVWDDASLAQDFRKAMIALLDTRLADDQDPLGVAVLDWLRGDLKGLRAVRSAQIGARINRFNARAMLISLCRWVRQCGLHGLLVTLDISQLLLERRAVEAGFAYSTAAVMDGYEVIRQVIDDAEEFHGLLLVVTSDRRMIDGSAPKRDLSQYTALKMRVWDDVRPQGRDNPLSPLVTVAA